MPNGAADELVFLPLGGIGEIGMNLALYGFGPPGDRRWLMVDCGVSFGGGIDLPGIDLVMADTRFIESELDRLVGIVVTHAHEDHYGALFDLWPRLQVPVYMTRFTAALLEAKRAGERDAPRIPVTVVAQGGRIRIGPFDVEFLPVSHSLPEPNALAIRTPLGLVVHTGDWKIDPTPGIGLPIDLGRFAELGEEGVAAVIGDSTNATREGRSPSEADVAETFVGIMRETPRRVAVTIFASNVARIRSVALAAQAAGRDVVIGGRAIRRVVDVARELGMLDDVPPFLDEEAYGYLPPDKVAALLTGSQGEPRAMLAKLASGEHPAMALGPGDLVVFSSRTIPGNEKAIGAIMNGLTLQGVRVMTDRDALVHVSGHPRRDEIRELYALLRPRALVPAHGEPVHLEAHAELGREIGIPEIVRAVNGKLVRLLPGPASVVGERPSGILVKDGRLLKTPDGSGVADRRRLSYAGAVSVAVVLDDRGDQAVAPVVSLFGLPDTDDRGEPFDDIVEAAVDGTLASIPRPRRRDPEVVAEAVRRAVRSAVNERWGKKPLCDVVVTRL